MDLPLNRPIAFDPTRFGTRWHRAIRGAPARLFDTDRFCREPARRTLSADLCATAEAVIKVADRTLNAIVGTGLGEDSAQIKRGIFGPYKDGMIEGTSVVLRHAFRAFATYWGIGASVTVGLIPRWRGQPENNTTEHWVYWAKGVTDRWAGAIAQRSGDTLTLGEEACKATTAVLEGVAMSAAVGLALAPAALHACCVGAASARQERTA